MVNSPNIFKMVLNYEKPTNFQVTNLIIRPGTYTSIMNIKLEIPVYIVRKKHEIINVFSYLYI